MQVVFACASLCLFVPVFYHRDPGQDEVRGVGPDSGISFQGKIQLAAFCAFEAMVGVFWPSMMTMRSAYVPEEMRSTIINFFRIPLNLFVCVVLYNVSFFINSEAAVAIASLRTQKFCHLLCRCPPSLWQQCLACARSS
jgi:hypothetical protein